MHKPLPRPKELQMALSLPVPHLGIVRLPDKSPYNPYSSGEVAYFDGFVVGWQIIQDAGEGALVYAPEEYSANEELCVAWHRGVADGKSAADNILLELTGSVPLADSPESPKTP